MKAGGLTERSQVRQVSYSFSSVKNRLCSCCRAETLCIRQQSTPHMHTPGKTLLFPPAGFFMVRFRALTDPFETRRWEGGGGRSSVVRSSQTADPFPHFPAISIIPPLRKQIQPFKNIHSPYFLVSFGKKPSRRSIARYG